MRTRDVVALAGVIIAIAVVPAPPQAAGQQPGLSALRVEPVPSPAAAGTEVPQMTVSSRGVLLSWVERDGPRASLKYAERTASGWSAPQTAAAGNDWFVNWADVPSVIRLADGTLAAHWLQKQPRSSSAYDIRLAYSKDDGKTWSAPFTPHHDGTQTEHGFASLYQAPLGLGLVWLDGRAMTPGAHDAAAGHGGMSVRSGTFDAAWKQTSETAVDLKVCECCPTTVAVTADGVIAAYRNVSDDGVRDIYVSRLEAGKWTAPVAVHDDGWKINACPVNGPALSARGRNVVVAWFTGKQEPGQSFAAFSKDAGRTFGPPVRLDDGGSTGRVDVELLPDGSAIASWLEYVERRAEFRIRRVDPSGTKSAPVTVAGLAAGRASGYPRIAWNNGEAVLAWTESTRAAEGGAVVTKVQTARAR